MRNAIIIARSVLNHIKELDCKIWNEIASRRHDFWETLHTPLGEVYRKCNKNQIEHPIALRDRGKRILDVLTDVSYLTPEPS